MKDVILIKLCHWSKRGWRGRKRF